MLRLKRRRLAAPIVAVDVQHPEAGQRAGRNADVAIGLPPEPLDGFGVCGGGMKAARDGRLLSRAGTGNTGNLRAA